MVKAQRTEFSSQHPGRAGPQSPLLPAVIGHTLSLGRLRVLPHLSSWPIFFPGRHPLIYSVVEGVLLQPEILGFPAAWGPGTRSPTL